MVVLASAEHDTIDCFQMMKIWGKTSNKKEGEFDFFVVVVLKYKKIILFIISRTLKNIFAFIIFNVLNSNFI